MATSRPHRIHPDAEAIAGLNDGNELIDGQPGIVVRGQLGIKLICMTHFYRGYFPVGIPVRVSTVSPGSPAEVEQTVERLHICS